MYYAFVVGARWLAFWLDVCSLMLLAVASLGAVALKSTLSPGVVGLALSYLMQLTGLVQWLIRQVGLERCGQVTSPPRSVVLPPH